MSEHTRWEQQIPFYIAQSLSPEERRAFEAHLATCERCQHEIDEWRMIASAVWREADDAARKLPPLSPDVYNRLHYRDREPVSQFSANPPPARVTDRAQYPQARRIRSRGVLPLTMVAGLIVAFLFGGLLIVLALGRERESDPSMTPAAIALQATSQVQATQSDVYASAPQPTTTPQPSSTLIIVPMTQQPDSDETIPVLTPTRQSTTGAQIGTLSLPRATAMPSDRFDESADAANLTSAISAGVGGGGGGGGGTLDRPPQAEANVPLCDLINPTDDRLPMYIEPDLDSFVLGALLPEQRSRVVLVSDNGWYQAPVAGDGSLAWMPPEYAYLEGNCDLSVLPNATTIAPIATPLAPTQSSFDDVGTYEVPREETFVIITAAYADGYAEPSFDSPVQAVVGRNDELLVRGFYQKPTGVSWVQVQLEDNRIIWLWQDTLEIKQP